MPHTDPFPTILDPTTTMNPMTTEPPDSTLRPIQTCATCRHWERPSWMNDEWGHCELTEMRHDVEVHPESKAQVSADWSGILTTAADFGCNQHQPKENDDAER